MSNSPESNWKRAFNTATAAVVLAGGLAFAPGTASAQSQTETEAEDSSAVGEIVVTATRREENLQDVPLAVTAFSGEALAETRIQTFADLAQATPGPTFVPISGASGSQLQMRGQYASDDSPAFDTPVGIFIDDIYYGSVASFYPDFYDIEQLAVLRGPQGTTFGRNTVGGALQITSRRPSFDGYEGTVTATIRSQDGFESTGAFNMPLTDNLAARFAYSVKNVGGDVYNVTTGNHVNDANIWSGRASLLWQASPNIDVLASASYTRDDSLGDGPVLIGQGALIASLNNPYDSGNTYLDDDGKTERDIFNAFVRADWRMDWGTLTSITGYRTLDAFYREDIDGSPVEIAPNKIDINEEEQFSQEIRLTSNSGGAIEWVAGVYYLHQQTFRSETYTFGAPASTFIFGSPWRINAFTGGNVYRVRIAGDIETESIAPFGELTWHLNDQWAITGGVRYTYDQKENVTDQQNLTTPGATTVFFGLPKTVAAEESWDAWTPRVILEFQPTQDIMLYASASRGFKSGGYNYAAPTVAQAQTPILPETNTSYEIGAKTTWLDGRFRANLALYDAVTEDLQVRSLVGTTLQVNNAGEAEVQGLELELLAVPVDALTLGFNYAYTDAVYNDYRGCATYTVTNPAPPPATLTVPWDCSGNRIPFVPENSFNVFAQYEWRFANDATLTARIEDSWADAYEVHIGNGDLNPTLAAQGVAAPGFGPLIPRGLTEKDHTINGFLTYEAPGGDWQVQLWGRNLTDERYVTFATNYFFYLLTNAEATAAAPATLTEADRASVSRGRSFGVTATFNLN
ncbi:MAG: TonB-dependent receptor [Hydrogenophilaceae bacterium]|jgi:iron complex outermembrane receptor protein|nr:TonB-dependent receptor [Hydrogenophilaceae bacterium]